MKTKVTTVVAVVLAIMTVIAVISGLAAFAGGEDVDEHVCTYRTLSNTATCTDDGQKVSICTRCGEKKTDDIIALGHDFKFTVNDGFSCTEGGERIELCSRCGTEKRNFLEPSGHNLKSMDGTAPSCTESGFSAYMACINCAYIEGYQVLAALGHDEIAHEAVPSTCIEHGCDEYLTCSRCDYTTYVALPLVGHNYVDTICSVCGDFEIFETNGTEGLAYRLNDDGASYSCSGIGRAESTNIVIASVVNGLPVNKIYPLAFYCNSDISSVEIPHTIVDIGHSAFFQCTSLSSVLFAEESTCEKIGESAFIDCNISSITIPASVKEICDSAFAGCHNLTTVQFESGSQLTSIFEGAFSVCYNLKEFSIPESVSFIASGSFTGCDNLLSEKNGVLYVDKWVVGRYNTLDDATTINLRNDTVGIAEGVFMNMKELTKVDLHDNLTSICENAFKGCWHLSEVNLYSSVRTIGEGAFSGCYDLVIYVEDAIKPIGWHERWESSCVVIWDYKNVNFISFFIVGEIQYSEVGMTWGEWIDSDYNRGNFYAEGDYVKYPTKYVVYGSEKVLLTDVITVMNYGFVSDGTGGGGGTN